MERRAIGSILGGFLVAYIAASSAPATAQASAGAPGASLRGKHGEMRDALGKSPFGRPLLMDSAENGDRLKGEVYGVVDHPFERMRKALRAPGNWCEILVLPLHVKECRGDGNRLGIAVSSRPAIEEGQSVRLQFSFDAGAEARDYLGMQLAATEGPFGTRDYKIVFEAVPVDARRSFIHITYSYAYGSAAKMATQAYLGTAGKDKVGFTPGVNGIRGILERNAMRYFLAIDTYLASLSAPDPQRVDKRLRDWVAALERHPKQLRETEPDYVELKRRQMNGIARTSAG